MTAQTATLTDFVLARKTEATEAEIISQAALEAVEMHLPADLWDDWFAAFERTIWVQSVRANRAARNLLWVYAAVFARPLVKREAARYADHSDFREEWRV